ncbi:MAG TPA: glycerate kinase [Longimicrobiales bacterium]
MILVAPTSFKGTIGAAEAAAAMAAGARTAFASEEVRALPLSDGGPGLLDALAAAGGEVSTVEVTGPLGAPVEARLLRLNATVVVESADACGLHLVPPERRDPLRTTTRGVGELLRAASAREGVRQVTCGLGGSATVDGGAGLAAALGFELLDDAGAPIPEGGGGLTRLARIRSDGALRLPRVTGLVDVRSPLLGPEGAAAVFGPQKGADAAGVAALEAGLTRLADCLRRDLGQDVAGLPGAGAAGGLGAGLVAFAGARLLPGSAWVLEAVEFERALERARLVVTGEGSYDEQSALGKLTGEVVRRARAVGVPVLLLCGAIQVPLPEGVLGLDGAGRLLTTDDLAALTAAGCTRLLAG